MFYFKFSSVNVLLSSFWKFGIVLECCCATAIIRWIISHRDLTPVDSRVKCKPTIGGWLVSLYYCCLPKWLWSHRVLWLCNSGSQWPQIEIHLKSHQLRYQLITNKEIRDTYQHNLDMLVVLHSVFTTGLFSLVKHLEGIQVKALSWLMFLIMVLLCSNWNCVLRSGGRSVRQSKSRLSFLLLKWLQLHN